MNMEPDVLLLISLKEVLIHDLKVWLPTYPCRNSYSWLSNLFLTFAGLFVLGASSPVSWHPLHMFIPILAAFSIFVNHLIFLHSRISLFLLISRSQDLLRASSASLSLSLLKQNGIFELNKRNEILKKITVINTNITYTNTNSQAEMGKTSLLTN